MDQLALRFKYEILGFIKAREEEKLVNLLWKVDKKKGSSDEKQALGLQLITFLSNCGELDKDEINLLAEEKNTNKDTISELHFAEEKFHKLSVLYPNQKDENLNKIVSNYKENKYRIQQDHKPDIWLEKYSNFASTGGVFFATHIPKMTHPGISGGSAFYVQKKIAGAQNIYLCTDRLSKIPVDVAIDNAAYTPIASLLKLEVDGQTVASYLFNNNPLPFKYLSEDNSNVSIWVEKFSSVFKVARLATNTLAKQVYFPINLDADYHLLCNVKSSSMAHIIFSKIKESLDNEVENLKEKGKFSERKDIAFIRRAKLAITSNDGAKNISPLNSERSGKLTLLCSQPPTWQFQPKPPIFQITFFDAKLRYQISKDNIDYLREYLIRFEKVGVSIKQPNRQKWIKVWVGRIIEDILAYASYIQNMKSGWSNSEGVRLKREHQLFLDPYCEENEFQIDRQTRDWQKVVCEDFARWLNKTLAGKDRLFTSRPEHTNMWIELAKDPIREQDDLIRLEIKGGKGNE